MSLSNNQRATILFRIFYAGADAIQGESLLSIRQYPVKRRIANTVIELKKNY